MHAEQLAQLILEQGAATMAVHIWNIVPAALNEGWDLTNWAVQAVPGALYFYQVDLQPAEAQRQSRTLRRTAVSSTQSIITDGERIMVINAPESERATWEERIRSWEGDGALVRIMMQPRFTAPPKLSARRGARGLQGI